MVPGLSMPVDLFGGAAISEACARGSGRQAAVWLLGSLYSWLLSTSKSTNLQCTAGLAVLVKDMHFAWPPGTLCLWHMPVVEFKTNYSHYIGRIARQPRDRPGAWCPLQHTLHLCSHIWGALLHVSDQAAEAAQRKAFSNDVVLCCKDAVCMLQRDTHFLLDMLATTLQISKRFSGLRPRCPVRRCA